MDNKKVFKLLLVEEGWGNLHLTISNMVIIDEQENTQVGTLEYDLSGYSDEDLERIGKTEEELMVHCNDVILEILESGLKESSTDKDEKLMDQLRKEL